MHILLVLLRADSIAGSRKFRRDGVGGRGGPEIFVNKHLSILSGCFSVFLG